VPFVAIRDFDARLQSRRNIPRPSFARAKPAHRRRLPMNIVATVMLVAIALYVLLQMEDLTY
jgi:hypothetical protein